MSKSTQVRRPLQSAALALFERELADYRADAPYLSVEKCARRCERLSALLAAATLVSADLAETSDAIAS